MNNIKFNKKALSQAYEILLRLDDEQFNKIPKDIISSIKENRDEDYEMDFNNLENEILPDTKKIIASIYSSYLTNLEEKSIIFRMIELEKKKKYDNKNLF